MHKQLIINCNSFETRVALIEGSSVVEYGVERKHEREIVGSIFKGKVTRVLPQMQCAFVDIGLERNAFLYAGDIHTDSAKNSDLLYEEDEESSPENNQNKNSSHINDLLKEGDELLVQVSKDTIGTKGARVTTFLSLPGRFIVLAPLLTKIGISKKISSEEERNRLKNVISKSCPKNLGCIVRTASENISEEKVEADIKFLVKTWDSIRKKAATAKAPQCVYEDLNLIYRRTRDLLSQDLDRIVIDSKQQYESLIKFVNQFSVKLGAKIQLYQGKIPIFDAYGIDLEMSHALDSKVWLKSGGYIIIEQTEALTAIDVNTGRFVGHKSDTDTFVRTNLEAVKEISLQLRLRNIGGIIILDFIDMHYEDDRRRVYSALVNELKKDRAKTTVLQISELGLVQMTRKRTEESLAQKLCHACPYCHGKGKLKSALTIVYQALREIIREFELNPGHSLKLMAHPSVSDLLLEEEWEYLHEIQETYKNKVIIESNKSFHPEYYEMSIIQNH